MVNRNVLRLGTGAVVGALAIGSLSIAPASAATTVPPSMFGMHINTIASAPIQTFATSGRIWDTGATWRQIETAEGVYNWTPLDNTVTNYRSGGQTNLQYVLGSTPAWCASKFNPKYDSRGPGSSSYPARDSCYLNYVRAVATRYKGRIQSYEIWNEADRPNFYTGTPEKLASLTKKTYALLKSIDRNIRVAAAGTIPRAGRFGKGSFEQKYYSGLKAAGWPIDAFMFALYPETPANRVKYLAIAKKALKKLSAPKRLPYWESEVNYFSNRGNPGRVFSNSKQDAYVAINYLQSPGLGLSRSYWYSWNTQQSELGIRMTNTNGDRIEASYAFANIAAWMGGKSWLGCKTSKKVTSCKTRGGTPTTIFYRMSGTSKIKAPSGSTKVCTILMKCTPTAKGKSITVGLSPLQIVGAK